MAYDGPSPLPLSRGATNATSFATSTGIVKYDGTRLVTSAGMLIDSSNRIINTLQPCFQAGLAATNANVTGDSTAYTIVYDTVAFDQTSSFSSTTFTAPVTGKYLLTVCVFLSNLGAAHTNSQLNILTTLRSYQYNSGPGQVRSANNTLTRYYSVVANMTAGNTASTFVQVYNGTKVVGVGGGVGNTFFSGALIC